MTVRMFSRRYGRRVAGPYGPSGPGGLRSESAPRAPQIASAAVCLRPLLLRPATSSTDSRPVASAIALLAGRLCGGCEPSRFFFDDHLPRQGFLSRGRASPMARICSAVIRVRDCSAAGSPSTNLRNASSSHVTSLRVTVPP